MGEKEKDLQEEIDKKGAKWKAGDTSISELSPEEQRRRLGLLPTKEEEEALKKEKSKKEKRSF